MSNALPDIPNVVAPPLALYIVAFLLGCFIETHARQAILSSYVASSVLGGTVFVLSGAFALWAFVSMRRIGTSAMPWKPTTALSTDGPFRITRNPIYVAMTGLYLGLTFVANSLWPLLSAIPLLVLMQWGVVLREERYLSLKFGEEYLAYRSRVPRWLLCC